jgi:predicted  nucleic acid-binding Zn-ribbon protein
MIINIILLIIIFILCIVLYLFFNNKYEYEFFTNGNNVIPAPTYNPNDLSNPFPTNSPLSIDYLLANSQILIPKTNELSKDPQITIPVATLNPVSEISSQTSLLTQLKVKNENLKNDTEEELLKLDDVKKQLLDVQNELEDKKAEKLRLSEQISNIDNARIANNTIVELILKGIDANINKENELTDLKKEIDEKKEKIEKLLSEPIAPVVIKEEQIEPLIQKLKDLEKKMGEISNKIPNNICTLNSNMPEPQKEAFINDLEQIQNPSYLWCMCNEENKNSSNCLDYMECNQNYIKNKDKTALISDDLTIYMKCLSKYPNFPKYLTENNKK